MNDFDAFIRAQVRFNIQIVRALDEAGVISSEELAERLHASADRVGGKEGEYLRGQAQGLIDGNPPHLTVIDGDKGD